MEVDLLLSYDTPNSPFPPWFLSTYMAVSSQLKVELATFAHCVTDVFMVKTIHIYCNSGFTFGHDMPSLKPKDLVISHQSKQDDFFVDFLSIKLL